jgi:hypothetical protein
MQNSTTREGVRAFVLNQLDKAKRLGQRKNSHRFGSHSLRLLSVFAAGESPGVGGRDPPNEFRRGSRRPFTCGGGLMRGKGCLMIFNDTKKIPLTALQSRGSRIGWSQEL